MYSDPRPRNLEFEKVIYDLRFRPDLQRQLLRFGRLLLFASRLPEPFHKWASKIILSVYRAI